MALPLLLLGACDLCCRCDCPYGPPEDAAAGEYPCHVRVRPVTESGGPAGVGSLQTLWFPVFNRTTGDYRFTCPFEDDCIPIWSNGGPFDFWTFGASFTDGDTYGSAQLWGFWKVVGFQSLLSPLVGCAGRYDDTTPGGALILDMPLLPLTGGRELCEDDPTLSPFAGNTCPASITVLDEAGLPIERPMIMNLDVDGGGQLVLSYVSSMGVADLLVTAYRTDGTTDYATLLVQEPGYLPQYVCAPCATNSSWTLAPMPPLEELPPLGGW